MTSTQAIAKDYGYKTTDLDNKIVNECYKPVRPMMATMELKSETATSIQNRIFNAIEDVAEDEELDYVFDKSGDIVFLYAKEKYDITEKVLDKLE